MVVFGIRKNKLPQTFWGVYLTNNENILVERIFRTVFSVRVCGWDTGLLSNFA
jgi:hypothetical protein